MTEPVANVAEAEDRFLEGEPPGYVRVESVRDIAEEIRLIRLVAQDREELPCWEPGAHIDLVLASGRVRSYSLCSDPDDRSHYEIAVLREPKSSGGSMEIFASDLVGHVLGYIAPRNHFELVDAPAYLLLGGGIGVAPLMPMMRELDRRGAAWRVLYAGRRPSSMAFLDDVAAYGEAHATILFEDEVGRPDIAALFSSLVEGTVVYCCGPRGMIAAAEAASWRIGTRNLHLERFHPTIVPASVLSFGGAFDVRLARSELTVHVPSDKSVLAAVRELLPGVPSSCGSGSCGVCETRVLAGGIEHRDRVLSAAECERGDSMMICVSRATDGLLVLDL